MDEEGDRTKGEVDDLRDADERATKEKAGQSPKRYCGKRDFFKRLSYLYISVFCPDLKDISIVVKIMKDMKVQKNIILL